MGRGRGLGTGSRGAAGASARKAQGQVLALIAVLCGLAFWAGLRLAHGAKKQRIASATAFAMHGEPATMLWAWETPEDLEGLRGDGKVGVAFLAGEVLVGSEAEVRPRQQPLRVGADAWLMGVVRIEVAGTLEDSAALRQQVAGQIATLTEGPDVRAVQVDFDATASQREFYAGMLRELRKRLPAGKPLSITALTSWCGERSWMHELPVDEAVPMFFRMGGPARGRSTLAKDAGGIAEPLCGGSAGVATDETWPAMHSGERVYIFRTGPWTVDDLVRVNSGGYAGFEKGE